MIEQPVLLNDRYQLEAPLGSGGMAMVYRARDLMLERAVAIKILRKNYANDPTFRERFRLEAKAAANLTHPNIATVHDFGLDANQLFFVMELIPGTDLKKMLKQRGRLSPDEAIDLLVQACAGIGYAHRAGLVHCDIKPQNILITPDRRVKVVDFGIARALSSVREDEPVEVVWGSPQYFSPEQAAGEAPTPASDVYSLGIVLFEMLTGQVPFTADSSEELARLHQEALPPSPRKINQELSPALEKIVLKVLAKEPTARYQTADQLGHVLHVLGSPPIEDEVTPTLPKVDRPSPTPVPLSSAVPATHYSYPPASHHIPIPRWQSARSRATPPKPQQLPIDWLSWMLLLLAVLMTGGLIPFWLWVIYHLRPPI